MKIKMIPCGKVLGIRAWTDGHKKWFLLEDVRHVLKKPKLQGIGERSYMCFDRGPWITVRLRLISEAALMEYARMYSDLPGREWRTALDGAPSSVTA